MKKGGFTLLEIMIVVSVVGLLAVLAIPNLLRARQNSLANKCINNLRLIAAAKDQYAFENVCSETTVPIADDVILYLKGDAMPACPYDNDAYNIGELRSNPTCPNEGEVDGHVL